MKHTALVLVWGLMTAAAGAQSTADCVDTNPEHWRYVLLVEWAGGNDGLNTVVPFHDPAYASARPHLKLDPGQATQLSGDLAFHPALAPLMELWQEGSLGVVLGIGYQGQNRSHFRSMDIWETASDPNQVLTKGWITRALQAQALPSSGTLADALVLGESRPGPLVGDHRIVSLKTIASFQKQAEPLRAPASSLAASLPGTGAQQWDDARALLLATNDYLSAHPDPHPDQTWGFTETSFGEQMATARDLIQREVPVHVLKLTLRGFDTHVFQADEQARLLGDFATNLAALERALGPAWGRVLVVTYSEFGRRIAENGSEGTDHGAASVSLVAGGLVRGGLYGTQPPVDQPVNGDLAPNVDFRRLWVTVAQFLEPGRSGERVTQDSALYLARPYAPLDLLRS